MTAEDALKAYEDLYAPADVARDRSPENVLKVADALATALRRNMPTFRVVEHITEPTGQKRTFIVGSRIGSKADAQHLVASLDPAARRTYTIEEENRD